MAQPPAQLAYLERPCSMTPKRPLPADFESSSATEQPIHRAKLLQSSSRNAVVKMPLRWDTEFWLEKRKESTPKDISRAGDHHPRKPDLSMCIRIYMRTERDWAWQVRSGVYLGHGQSKTTFRLISNGSETYEVLKIARKKDIEPEVFCAVSNYDLCTPILHNGWGKQVSDGGSYHCWITERTIPLDEFVKCRMADRKQCTLAAFICVLECISIGLQISDTHFFNFGVRFFSDLATEHVVVLIDAGSRGWQPDSPRWSKKEVNQKTMKKFWIHAARHNAQDPDLEDLWRKHHNVGSALAAAKAKWAKYSMLTHEPLRWQQILESLGATAEEETQEMKRNAAYNIIHFVASQRWHPTATFDSVCYKAYKQMQFDRKQDKILNDLHWRMTNKRWSDASVYDIVGFWYSLLEYRVNVLSQRPWSFSENAILTPTEVTKALHKWQDDFLWYEATAAQRQKKSSEKKSFLRAMLNKKAAWSYAAIAVLEIGLPILTLSDETNAPTVHVCEMAKFAEAMASWLQQFSAAMVKHQESECYQAALKYSSLDMSEADRGNKPPSNDKTQRFHCA